MSPKAVTSRSREPRLPLPVWLDSSRRAKLERLAARCLHPQALRPDAPSAGAPRGLLAELEAFPEARCRGVCFEAFDVDSENCTEQSEGTSAWIAHRGSTASSRRPWTMRRSSGTSRKSSRNEEGRGHAPSALIAELVEEQALAPLGIHGALARALVREVGRDPARAFVHRPLAAGADGVERAQELERGRVMARIGGEGLVCLACGFRKVWRNGAGPKSRPLSPESVPLQRLRARGESRGR